MHGLRPPPVSTPRQPAPKRDCPHHATPVDERGHCVACEQEIAAMNRSLANINELLDAMPVTETQHVDVWGDPDDSGLYIKCSQCGAPKKKGQPCTECHF